MTLARSGGVRHVVIAEGPGQWADPQRAATDVAAAVRLAGSPSSGSAPSDSAPSDSGPSDSGSPGRGWLEDWQRAGEAALRAADAVLDADADRGLDLTEPLLARELLASVPAGALVWAGNSMSVRDIDWHLRPRADLSVLASRGASGIDGTTSTAAGAALAHTAAGGGPSFALIGDLAFLHDAPGLAIGPDEPRPDLCVVVVNNDGGGIFESLEPAAFPAFERVFGTPHGMSAEHLAAAFNVPYTLVTSPGELAKALDGAGFRVVEARTDRAANAALRAQMRAAAIAAAENP
jgi:2-succinyl-5-enolpyruvyl-6-hydroxy-3-cyclohexene-1-carboxylate synthase